MHAISMTSIYENAMRTKNNKKKFKNKKKKLKDNFTLVISFDIPKATWFQNKFVSFSTDGIFLSLSTKKRNVGKIFISSFLIDWAFVTIYKP